MLKLAPESIFIVKVFIERNLYNSKSIASRRSCLFLFDFAVSKDEVFERLGHAIFDFIDIGTWVNCNDNALAHGKIRELVLANFKQPVNAKYHQNRTNQEYNGAVPHRGFYK